MDRVNLREQVVWSHPANDEDTQMMAEDYLRMGAARMKQMLPPEPYKPEQEMSTDILVVGGGTTGMTAALEVARAGYLGRAGREGKRAWRFSEKRLKKCYLPVQGRAGQRNQQADRRVSRTTKRSRS